MKKILSLFFVIFMAANGDAQLKVDSLGRIKIGSNLASSGNTYNTTIGTSRNGALYIHNNNNLTSQYGVNVTMTSSNTSPIGINANIVAQGASIVYGVRGLVSGGLGYNSYKSVGVLGAADIDPNSVFTAGVVGSTSYYINYPSSGNYAAYFVGDIRTTGSMYGTLLSPSSISSTDGQSLRVNSINNNENSVVEKL